ncbi:MAG: OsmC family protein [Prevotella sp.]|jgi:uncharacterized OsmC-like protein|nr:OsmC family protein [Prevotella sp.]
MKIYSQDTKKRISILAIIILSVFGTTSVDAQTDNANTGPNSVFVKDAVKKTFEQNASPLRNYLFSRREALIKLQSLPSEELQAVTLEARTTAEQRSGLRRMRIRGFQIISDSGTDFAGYNVGPGSPESQVAIIASDLADSYLNQAALRNIPVDSLRIEIINRPDAVPANKVNYPRNFLYTAYIKSSADDKQLEELRKAAEANSPIFNFILKPQVVTGEIDYTRTPDKLVIPEGGQPGLREYLKYKRAAYLHLQEEGKKREEERKKNPSLANNENRNCLVVTVNNNGVRQLQIRQFRILHDNPAYLGGSDLGPTSQEHQLGVLTSCLTHIFLIQAAARQIPLDSLEVNVKATSDIRAGRSGFENVPGYPYGIHYTVHVKSSATYEQIKVLRDAVEAVCPIYNLLKDEQTIEGRIVKIGN